MLTKNNMPLQQHPVPQQISSYEFRLVGDMTLKQFLQLAGGIFVGFILYVLPLPGFIKWPLVVFSSLSGAALAFLPYQERPLSVWLFSFVKAIYSPTLYVWKDGGSEDVFSKEGLLSPVIVTPHGEDRAKEYLAELPQHEEISRLEEKERGFFKRVTDIVQSVSFPHGAGQGMPAPQLPPVLMVPPPPAPEPMVPQPPVPNPFLPKNNPQEFPFSSSVPSVAAPPEPAVPPVPAPIPTPGTPAQNATFDDLAAPPNPAQLPNTVVGQVLDTGGRSVESAILEIREAGGVPARALRTNKLGHFLSVTPLKDGNYEIETERDGMEFPIVGFKAQGALIPPILIRAKS